MPQTDVDVIHSAVRGRARFRIEGLRRSPRIKRLLETSLVGGIVRSVSANSATGTTLVMFDATVEISAVAQLIRRTLRRALDEPDAPSRIERPGGSDWHKISLTEVFSRLESGPAGLTADQVRDRLETDGRNVIAGVPPRRPMEILLGQVTNVPVAVLGVGVVLSLATGGVADALVILGVIALNAGIGFATESKAEQTINALSDGALGPCSVVRDGATRTIAGEMLVPGDVLDLRSGVVVPADARLIRCDNLTVSEAALTGESVPVAKLPDRLPFGPTLLADRTNMVFRGTIVTGGTGRAIIVATGTRTELGQIQTSLGVLARPETPMQIQLDRLGRQLVFLSLGICGLIFVIGLVRGYRFLPMLKSAVSLAIAAVPEGLPALATTTLAIGIADLRKRGVLIRRLPAVEGLSSVQVICFDKTGTLTLNRMSVTRAATASGHYRFDDGIMRVGDSEEGPAVDVRRTKDLRRLLELCALCNDAFLKGDGAEPEIVGSPTEAALLQAACAVGIDVEGLREKRPRLAVVERSEQRSYMATTHRSGRRRLLAVKGSPDEVLGLCRSLMVDGHSTELTGDKKRELRSQNRLLAEAGLRVLGVAEGSGDLKDLTWVGLVGFADPLRRDARRIIEAFHRAGISTLMITGDQAATAAAVAEQLGLHSVAEPRVGSSLARLASAGESAASDLLATHIFARVTPAQKLRIVQNLQEAGLVIAMTGDGVNDAPSLRAADIGIALGGGTDAARQTADVILLEDELGGLVAALEQGRATYYNIQRAIRYLLATNIGEITLMFAVTASGMGQPLTPVQLLWINLITDVLPAIGIALDRPPADLMQRSPRPPNEPIVSTADAWPLVRDGFLVASSSLAAQAYGIVRYGASPRTGAISFTTLAAAQLFYAFSSRGPAAANGTGTIVSRRHFLPGAVGLSFAAQMAALFVPGLRRLCGGPISLLDTGVALGIGTLPLLLTSQRFD